VNPGHLFLGTYKDNVADAAAKGRRADQCGGSNGNSKLTEYQVAEIRKRYVEGGITQVDLAREYGVSFYAVNDIVLGKRWAHVS